MQENNIIKLKRKIGFDYKGKDEITDKEVEQYLNYFYENGKNGTYPGYTKVADNTALKRTEAQKIRATLERLKVVGTKKQGNIIRSIALIDKQQAVRKIQKL